MRLRAWSLTAVLPLLAFACSSPTPLTRSIVVGQEPTGAAGTSSADDPSGAAGTSSADVTAGAAGATDPAAPTGDGIVGAGGGPALPGVDPCATSAGDTEEFSSVPEVYDVLAGRWLFCGGVAAWPAPFVPADVVGIEFEPAKDPPLELAAGATGAVHYLVPGPSGPVRAAGAAYNLRYDVVSWRQVDLFLTTNSAFFVNNRRVPGGHEITLQVMYKPNATRLVRF